MRGRCADNIHGLMSNSYFIFKARWLIHTIMANAAAVQPRHVWRCCSLMAALALATLQENAQAQVQRIVSLLPSATEAVCALGACDQIVGVDAFSLDPPEVLHLPRLGKTWQPNLEAIVQLQPDLVLVGRSPQILEKLRALGLNVHEVDALTIDDVYQVLRRLDRWLGTQRAEAVINQIQQKLDALRMQSAQLARQDVYVEVDAALYSAAPSSFMGELLQVLNANNIAATQSAAFPKLSPEYVLWMAPNLIIQTYERGAQVIHQRPGWTKLPAVTYGRICSLNAEERRIATRPGPRMAEAAEIFLRCMRMPFIQETNETQ